MSYVNFLFSLASTDFQPSNARKAFPCFDEPMFKAPFKLTIIRDKTFSSSLGNYPLEKSVER